MTKPFGARMADNNNNTSGNQGEVNTDAVDKLLVDSKMNSNEKAAQDIINKYKDVQHIKEVIADVTDDKGMTLLSPEDYAGFSPDIKVSPARGRASQGLSSAAISSPTVLDSSGQPGGRAATDIDVSKLDESQIMSMPVIKAIDSLVPNILFLKPIDPTIRFRWVNFKNYEGGNLQRYKAIGFQSASVEDVDVAVTPVEKDCVDGTLIKWYDVMLMKINVFKLMGLYKRNMIASLKMVGRFQENAQSMAQAEFTNLINNGLVDSGANKGQSLRTAFRRMKEAGYNVGFYVPGLNDDTDREFMRGSDENWTSGAALPNQ